MGEPVASRCPDRQVFLYDADDLYWAERGVPFWPYRPIDENGYPIAPEKWLELFYAGA